MAIHFINARILRNHAIKKGELWVSDGKISGSLSRVDSVIDLQGKTIVPGFIDLQINGGFGIDFTGNPEKVGTVAAQLGKYGVTSFLATVISSTPKYYHDKLPLLLPQLGSAHGAELLGFHLEGPCFNPRQAKAHKEELMRSCNEFFSPNECYSNMTAVKIVTLAPEVAGADKWIEWLVQRGIVVSAGHSESTSVEMQHALDKGVKMVTHLYNAMIPFEHRSPGIIGTVLTNPNVFYSVICDGVHVDPMAIRMAWYAQPKGFVLVSDGMAALGLVDGLYSLGDREVMVHHGVARVVDSGVLAGATTGMDRLLRNFCEYTGASLIDACEAASMKPAKLLGIYPRKGSLEVGADADLVILDDDIQVVSTYVRGNLTYSS